MYVFKNNHFYSFLHRRSRSRVTYILNKNLSLQYDVSHETYRNNKADSHRFIWHLLTGSSIVTAIVVVVFVLSALLAGRALSLHNPRYFCEKKENKCEIVGRGYMLSAARISSKRVHGFLFRIRKFCLIGASWSSDNTGEQFVCSLQLIDRSLLKTGRPRSENFLFSFCFSWLLLRCLNR